MKSSGSIDAIITILSMKRCTKGTTCPLLLLPDKESNSVLVARFLFWHVVWKRLKELGWVLDADGNTDNDFIIIPPQDVNEEGSREIKFLKANRDFFDDETKLMSSLSTDPKYARQGEIRKIREEFEEYMVHYGALKSLVIQEQQGLLNGSSNRVPPDVLSSNECMIQYLKFSVESKASPKRKVPSVGHTIRDPAKQQQSQLQMIRAIIDQDLNQQRKERHEQHRKKALLDEQEALLRKMILAEQERRNDQTMMARYLKHDAPRQQPQQLHHTVLSKPITTGGLLSQQSNMGNWEAAASKWQAQGPHYNNQSMVKTQTPKTEIGIISMQYSQPRSTLPPSRMVKPVPSYDLLTDNVYAPGSQHLGPSNKMKGDPAGSAGTIRYLSSPEPNRSVGHINHNTNTNDNKIMLDAIHRAENAMKQSRDLTDFVLRRNIYAPENKLVPQGPRDGDKKRLRDPIMDSRNEHKYYRTADASTYTGIVRKSFNIQPKPMKRKEAQEAQRLVSRQHPIRYNPNQSMQGSYPIHVPRQF